MAKLFNDPEEFGRKFELLFVYAGEHQQPVCDEKRAELNALETKGINNAFY